MDRDEIAELLHELGVRIDRRGARGEMFLVGGAAMALAYSTRRSTDALASTVTVRCLLGSASSSPSSWPAGGRGQSVASDAAMVATPVSICCSVRLP
jgi:hypothetical protein